MDYVHEIAKQAMHLKISISEVCRRANVPRQWFERAKKYNRALDYLNRLYAALEQAEAAKKEQSNKTIDRL